MMIISYERDDWLGLACSPRIQKMHAFEFVLNDLHIAFLYHNNLSPLIHRKTHSHGLEKITNILRAQGKPDYIDEVTTNNKNDSFEYNTEDVTDELYSKALEIIKLEGKASTSFLQRKLQIGYNRAARIIDTMEEKGIVSKANHVGKREVL